MHDCIGPCSIADDCSTCVCDRNRQVCMKLLDLHKHQLCALDGDDVDDGIKGNRCVVRCVTCALISKLPTREKRAPCTVPQHECKIRHSTNMETLRPLHFIPFYFRPKWRNLCFPFLLFNYMIEILLENYISGSFFSLLLTRRTTIANSNRHSCPLQNREIREEEKWNAFSHLYATRVSSSYAFNSYIIAIINFKCSHISTVNSLSRSKIV